MVITWVAAFADVPEPQVPAALEFWQAVTASSPGPAAGDRDEYLPLAGPDEDPYLWVQRVRRAEPDGGWHPDLMVDDLPAAVRHATELGATVVRDVSGLVVLHTPAGQPFCLLAGAGERRRARPRRGPRGSHSLLDQLCLDIPAGAFADERRFWGELTGWPQSARGEFVNLTRPATVPLRLLLQRLGADDGGPARAHADLACDDVPAERVRHQALGAEVLRIANTGPRCGIRPDCSTASPTGIRSSTDRRCWTSALTDPSATIAGMPLYRDEAVVLRVHKLGEADRIVTLLTKRHGRIRAVGKGVRRTTSRYGARLEPGSHIEVQLWTRTAEPEPERGQVRPQSSLDLITQAESVQNYGARLANDYPSWTAAVAICETAERLTPEEGEPALRQFLLVVGALRSLAEREHQSCLILDAFLIRSMSLAGWEPALADCAICSAPGPHAAFHVPSGGTVCAGCRPGGSVRPQPDSLELLSALLAGNWAVADAAGDVHQREASGLIAAHLQWHLERGIRSLPLVDR